MLLDLAGVIFQEQSTIDNTIHRILTHMLSLIRCERAMLLLVHETSQGTFSRVFDLDQVCLSITSTGLYRGGTIGHLLQAKHLGGANRGFRLTFVCEIDEISTYLVDFKHVVVQAYCCTYIDRVPHFS